MSLSKSRTIAPKFLPEIYLKNAVDYHQKLTKFGSRSAEYVARLLYDERMEKIWKDVEKFTTDSFARSLFFLAPLRSVKGWLSVDKRSENERSQALGKVLKTASSLKKQLSNVHNSQIVIGSQSSKSKKEFAESLMRLQVGLLFITERVKEILSEPVEHDPGDYRSSLPTHLGKKTAFRNFLIKEMYLYCREMGENRRDKRMIKIITEIVNVVSGEDTTYDSVRELVNRSRKRRPKTKKSPKTKSLKVRKKLTK